MYLSSTRSFVHSSNTAMPSSQPLKMPISMLSPPSPPVSAASPSPQAVRANLAAAAIAVTRPRAGNVFFVLFFMLFLEVDFRIIITLILLLACPRTYAYCAYLLTDLGHSDARVLT